MILAHWLAALVRPRSIQSMQRLRVLAIAVLVLLAPTGASGHPLTPDDLARQPEHVAGWVCYWICYAGCILLGNSGSQCDAVCTDSCFTIVFGPTCGPDSDRICG
jgi:hypothetical protein